MLFDLKSGKRRRVIQVVFGFLAFIFFISFVGFGIGSDAAGGIFDALGLGSGSGGSSDPQYEQQIEDAETRLETDPNDPRALLDLASYHYLSGTEGVTTDPETGVTEVSEDARQELEEAVAAWEDYLATKPKRPDTGTAANIAQAYVYLGDADGAATAQRIVAESQDSSAAYGQLAFYLYADLKIPAGDEAAEQAVEAADASNRGSVRRSLERIAEQAEKQKKQLAKQPQGATGGGQGIDDPFGALGGSAGAPAAPAPTP